MGNGQWAMGCGASGGVMSSTAQDAPKRLSSMEAFSAELDRIMPVLTRVARRFAPLGDADDVIQEACLAAWRYRHRFDPEQGSFQTWIVKILLNESYKTVGRRRRNGLLLGRLADRSHLSTETPSGSSDRQLETLIAGLPRRQREVIELYYFVDLPVQQVADLLGVSSGTVKSTLAGARRRIQFRLAGEETN
jgi:RNA polymerase sigma factor (sigma-70 family)